MEDEEISLQDMAPPKVDQDEVPTAVPANEDHTASSGEPEQEAHVPEPSASLEPTSPESTPQKASAPAEASSTPGQTASDDDNQEWEKVEKPNASEQGSGTGSPSAQRSKAATVPKTAVGSKVQGAVAGAKKVLKTGVFGGESSSSERPAVHARLAE